jgi:hypothetical protein
VVAVDETTTADEIDYILSTALFLFRIVFWDVLPCKMIVILNIILAAVRT